MKKIIPLFLALFLGGCMTPYKSEFSCPIDKESGVCGGMTEIYKSTNDKSDETKKVEQKTKKCPNSELEEMKKVVSSLYEYLHELDEKNSELKRELGRTKLTSKIISDQVVGVAQSVESINNKNEQEIYQIRSQISRLESSPSVATPTYTTEEIKTVPKKKKKRKHHKIHKNKHKNVRVAGDLVRIKKELKAQEQKESNNTKAIL